MNLSLVGPLFGTHRWAKTRHKQTNKKIGDTHVETLVLRSLQFGKQQKTRKSFSNQFTGYAIYLYIAEMTPNKLCNYFGCNGI